MANLTIHTDSGVFDTFGEEQIVQTFSSFNFEDITSRSGDYTNSFNLPLTNNNLKLIGYANFIPALNTVPYSKIECTLIIDGAPFKAGLLEIVSIQDTITVRFYSGNSLFFDKIKQIYLSDLDWEDLNHTWNYATVLASLSLLNQYYIYPAMDYGGQTLGGVNVDIRKIMPATQIAEILRRVIEQNGYTYTLNFPTAGDLESAYLPFTNQIKAFSTEVILYNQLEASFTAPYTTTFTKQYGYVRSEDYVYQNYYENWNNDGFQAPFIPNVFGTGTSANWNTTTREYTATVKGVYTFDATCDLVNYDYSTFTEDDVNDLCTVNLQIVFRIVVYPAGGGTASILGIDYCIVGSTNFNGTVELNVGDRVRYEVLVQGSVYIGVMGTLGTADPTPNPSSNTVITIPVEMDTTSYFHLDLSPALSFGSTIVYKSILPKIKCSEFVKDLCIRYGMILNINENTKVITINQIDTVYDNIPNALDWSDKLDESTLPNIRFKFDSYAQNNTVKHAEDKTIVSTPTGTNFNFAIGNNNLIAKKDIYISPFAPTENITFNTKTTSTIPIYNTTNSAFEKDVKPRICYTENVVGLFRITDGTTTSALIDIKRIYFIDETLPDLSMGFGINLMALNSQTLIDILQNLKIIKCNVNIKKQDIMNLDYFIPIYLEQYQSFFMISSINQFSYTQPQTTNIELIKLNQ